MPVSTVYLEDLDLRPGLFGLNARSATFLGKAINASSWIWSNEDEQAVFTHSWMVHDETGLTLEQRWRLGHHHIEDFIGQRILLYSHEDITEEVYTNFYLEHWSQKIGRPYPPFRLLLFWMPPAFRRKISFGLRVCSETTSAILEHEGIIDSCKGVSPDQQHEWALYRKGFHIHVDAILQTKRKQND